MNNVVYRSLVKEDYSAIKKLICTAFGFDEFIKDKKCLDLVLNVYLQECIISSSFSRVAEKDNKVIGFILGEAKNDPHKIRKMHNIVSKATTGLRLMFSGKKNREALKTFSKIQDTYNELMKGKKDDFQGCVQLFIVSPESRGLGVGKALMAQLHDYMKSMNVTSMYLYTDTRCNYGFYDSQNFKRLKEKKIYFNSLKENLNVFLYGYNF